MSKEQPNHLPLLTTNARPVHRAGKSDDRAFGDGAESQVALFLEMIHRLDHAPEGFKLNPDE